MSNSPPSSQQRQRPPCGSSCHIDVPDKDNRDSDTRAAKDQLKLLTDGYAGTIRRDATLIGNRPVTPEAERILPTLTRSDPLTTRSLIPHDSEGQPLLYHRKNGSGESGEHHASETYGPFHKATESSLRTEGEKPLHFRSTDHRQQTDNDIEMTPADINNEGQTKPKDTLADTTNTPTNIATEEVTPLLGGRPRLDHRDLDPLHHIDRPEYKYSKLALKVPQGEELAASTRAEGVEESPEGSPVPTLERRKTELIWRA